MGALAKDIWRHPDMAPERRDKALQLLFLVAAAMLGPDVARSIFVMESIIQSPGVQELFRQLRDEGREEGRVEGRAAEARSALLRVLDRRGFSVSADLQRRIDRELDVERLETWHDRAVTAATVDEIFDS